MMNVAFNLCTNSECLSILATIMVTPTFKHPCLKSLWRLSQFVKFILHAEIFHNRYIDRRNNHGPNVGCGPLSNMHVEHPQIEDWAKSHLSLCSVHATMFACSMCSATVSQIPFPLMRICIIHDSYCCTANFTGTMIIIFWEIWWCSIYATTV